MTDFLINKFIANNKEISDINIRLKYGNLSGGIGIMMNLILFGIKAAIGILSGSISIMGDAVNNLADAGSSVVTMFGFKLSAKPADPEHPFGHGRFEYLAGLIISITIIVIGIELLKSSIDKVMNPAPLDTSELSIIILSLSVAAKLWFGLFNRKLGNLINSPALRAAGRDSLSDCLVTTVVIACMVLYYFTGINLDAEAGAIVSLFVVHSGWAAAKDTLQPLIGEPPSQEMVWNIKHRVLENKKIHSIFDLVVHNYGPSRCYISCRIEICNELTLVEAHRLVDNLEKQLSKEFNAIFTIHIDITQEENEEIHHLKTLLRRSVRAINPLSSIYDLDIPEKNKACFYIMVPYDCTFCDEAISEIVRKDMAIACPGYELDISVKRV